MKHLAAIGRAILRPLLVLLQRDRLRRRLEGPHEPDRRDRRHDGNGIAHTAAASGFDVTLIDVAEAFLERGMSAIAANLQRGVDKGKMTAEDKRRSSAASAPPAISKPRQTPTSSSKRSSRLSPPRRSSSRSSTR